MKIRILTCTVIGATVLAAGPVAAGEFNGNDEFVPGGTNGRSDCSFSGLDEPDEIENGPFPDDELWINGVQNYGQLVRRGLGDAFPGPGQACRGNAGHEG